jgi:hypothetical protein
VFQLVDDLRRFAAHEFDRVLVAQVVAALDGVEHVPVPVVFAHVAERGADAALRRHRVRAGREHFGQHRHVQAGFGQLQRCAHAGAAGADDDRVEAAGRNSSFNSCHDYTLQRICTAQTAQPSSHSMVATCRVRRTPTGFDVIHPDVAHADPGVIEQAGQGDEGDQLEPLLGEQAGPAFIAEVLAGEEGNQQDGGVEHHHDGGDALGQPVFQAVVGTDHAALGTDIVICHLRILQTV